MSKPSEIEPLVRQNIRDLVPYSSARSEYSGNAVIWLDANENPYNSPYNRYPDPSQTELKGVISERKEIPVERLFLGNGSDEGIDLLFRVFCDPGVDNVITVDPTYGMYGVSAEINWVQRKSVLLNADFSLDAGRVLDTVDERTKMIFLCSPNNPTSNSLDRGDMVRIVDEAGCLVVVDEAYIDFSEQPSLASLAGEKSNLVVLQTLSKAWGLAGIRLGMVIAAQELVRYLSMVKYPYNLNSLTIKKALSELKRPGGASGWVEQIINQRGQLQECLQEFGFVQKIHSSDSNFLLVRVGRPRHLYEFLLNKGIVIRNRSSVPLCEGCVRITVGTPEENRMLCEALKEYDG